MSGGYPFHNTQSPRNSFYQERHKPFSPEENADFIPLGFSSPIHHPRGTAPQSSRGFHRRSYGGLPSGHNSSGSPYNNNSYNRNTRSFNNRSGGRRVIICQFYKNLLYSK